jgi:hypothetical protein
VSLNGSEFIFNVATIDLKNFDKVVQNTEEIMVGIGLVPLHSGLFMHIAEDLGILSVMSADTKHATHAENILAINSEVTKAADQNAEVNTASSKAQEISDEWEMFEGVELGAVEEHYVEEGDWTLL